MARRTAPCHKALGGVFRFSPRQANPVQGTHAQKFVGTKCPRNCFLRSLHSEWTPICSLDSRPVLQGASIFYFRGKS